MLGSTPRSATGSCPDHRERRPDLVKAEVLPGRSSCEHAKKPCPPSCKPGGARGTQGGVDATPNSPQPEADGRAGRKARELDSLVTDIMAVNGDCGDQLAEGPAFLRGFLSAGSLNACRTDHLTSHSHRIRRRPGGGVRPLGDINRAAAKPGLSPREPRLQPDPPAHGNRHTPTRSTTKTVHGRLPPQGLARLHRSGLVRGQSWQVFIRGRPGLAGSMLHSDIEIKDFAVASDPSLQTTGFGRDLRPELELQHRPRVRPGDAQANADSRGQTQDRRINSVTLDVNAQHKKK